MLITCRVDAFDLMVGQRLSRPRRQRLAREATWHAR